MNTKKIALITEGFGHGFYAVRMALSLGLEVVAFSEKENREEFEAQVAQIMTNLSFIAPTMRPASWGERDALLRRGWNVRKSLLDGEITEAEWKLFAEYPALQPEIKEPLPRFLSVPRYKTNIMFVPQKLVSDGQCGVSAAQQSVQPEAFNFLKALSNVTLILGQHFHRLLPCRRGGSSRRGDALRRGTCLPRAHGGEVQIILKAAAALLCRDCGTWRRCCFTIWKAATALLCRFGGAFVPRRSSVLRRDINAMKEMKNGP